MRNNHCFKLKKLSPRCITGSGYLKTGCCHKDGITNEEGFTLVELSIALVIIGLLIGGILVGQSLIESAKVNAQVSQIQQFDAAVLSFKSKYRYLPGDATAFGGNGNNIIDMAFDNPMVVSTFSCEISNFWRSMDSSSFPGISSCSYPDAGTPATTKGANKNVPLSKLGKSGSWVLASGIASGYNSEVATTIANYYSILTDVQAKTILYWYRFATTSSQNSALTPIETLSLDKKMDDGISNSGNVLSGSIGNQAPPWGALNSTALTTCSNASGVYQVQNKGFECTPLIRIGAQAGNPQ